MDVHLSVGHATFFDVIQQSYCYLSITSAAAPAVASRAVLAGRLGALAWEGRRVPVAGWRLLASGFPYSWRRLAARRGNLAVGFNR